MKALIVQSNFELLLEAWSDESKNLHNELRQFLEVLKTPQHLYTYKLTSISLWEAFSNGLTAKDILSMMRSNAKYPVPRRVESFVRSHYKNYHRVALLPHNASLHEVTCDDEEVLISLLSHEVVGAYLWRDKGRYWVRPADRGRFKSDMVRLQHPVKDLVGFEDGQPLSVQFNDAQYQYRPYQSEAIASFMKSERNQDLGGTGIVVLPCGSGKTLVGLGVICSLQMNTLIITPNTVALRQWIRELIEKTSLSLLEVGEYSGNVKTIKPVTVATYSILTHRSPTTNHSKHFELFNKRRWGLVIYDEVHMLPAPVFRTIANLQSKRRLGLTATLIREDNREKDVFALIGPKRFDMPWRRLESERYIANALCYEIRVRMDKQTSYEYFNSVRNKFRLAAENKKKLDIVKVLLRHFQGRRILIIGQYLEQLKHITEVLGHPLITGKLPNPERQLLYERFNNGNLRTLVVSKVANFAIDLPNAEVGIQLSGTYGSRQEEAQRLGRIIRPKSSDGNHAYFITLTTMESREEYFAHNRKRFLVEQGYHYSTYKDTELKRLLSEIPSAQASQRKSEPRHSKPMETEPSHSGL